MQPCVGLLNAVSVCQTMYHEYGHSHLESDMRLSQHVGRREHMNKQVLRHLAVGLTLAGALVACGGSDVDTAVDALARGGEEIDVKLDKACTKKVLEKMSKEDLKLILDAEEDEDPVLSEAGEALQTEVFTCVDNADFVNAIMTEIKKTDDGTMDMDCVEKALKGLEPTALAEMATSGAAPTEFTTAIIPCVTGG
jgi:predicted component of type VI protein secretion system